jgi:hypothetical protein
MSVEYSTSAGQPLAPRITVIASLQYGHDQEPAILTTVGTAGIGVPISAIGSLQSCSDGFRLRSVRKTEASGTIYKM